MLEKEQRITMLERENSRLQSSMTQTITDYEARIGDLVDDVDRLSLTNSNLQSQISTLTSQMTSLTCTTCAKNIITPKKKPPTK